MSVWYKDFLHYCAKSQDVHLCSLTGSEDYGLLGCTLQTATSEVKQRIWQVSAICRSQIVSFRASESSCTANIDLHGNNGQQVREPLCNGPADGQV